MGFGIRVLMQGPRACFTRPEMKTERVSYDVITPSAARGILEAVYWKPAIAWRIDSIEVLNEIKFDTFRRNEVGSKLTYSDAKAAMRNDKMVYENASKDRLQRTTLYLKNVAYIVTAHFDMIDMSDPDNTPEKHYNIALRRLRKGQCFNQPYFGCREFVASVSLVEDKDEADLADRFDFAYRDVIERDLGFMLYDLDFKHGMEAQFFRATMRHGVIDVAQVRNEVIT